MGATDLTRTILPQAKGVYARNQGRKRRAGPRSRSLVILNPATLSVPCVDLDRRFSFGKLFDRRVEPVTKQCEQCRICNIAGGKDNQGRRGSQRQKVGVLGDDDCAVLDRLLHDRRVRFCRRERNRNIIGHMAQRRDPVRQSRRQLHVDQEAHCLRRCEC